MIDAISSSLAGATTQPQKLKAAAQQFEAVFLRQIISSMRATKLGDDILGSDSSEQFRDMADARTADAMAEKGAIGIADMLLKQFAHLTEAKPAADPTAVATSAKDNAA